MKRKTLLKRLEKTLPSFSLPFIQWGEEIDKTTDKRWLWEDQKNPSLPEQITEDYLVGIHVETPNGDHYTSARRFGRESSRMVKLDIMDFAFYGNTHKYGTLIIDGVEWHPGNDNKTSVLSSELREKAPLVQYAWDVELFKIIREEDGFFEEPGYETGSRTARFTSLAELYATAAYVALYRILGPFSLFEGSWATVPQIEELLLSVDSNDNVKIGSFLKKYWYQYFEKK